MRLFYSRRKRTKILLAVFKMTKKSTQSKQVTVPAKTANLANRQRCNQTYVAERLPPMDVGKMYLYEWQSHGGQSITNGDTGVGIGGRL